jgi:translation initiation factor 3 subunit C
VNEEDSASEAERDADGISDESDMEDSEGEAQKKVQFSKQAPTSAAQVDDSGFTIVGKGGKVIEVSQKNLLDNLADLLEERGKKSTDKMLLIQNIGGLLKISSSPYQSLKVLLALIPARFDYTSSTGGYTPIEIWKCALEELNNLFDILEKFPNASVGYLEDDLDQNETILEKVIFLKLINSEVS